MICLPMISLNAPFKSAKYFTDSIITAACEVHVKESPSKSNLGTKARWPQAWDAPYSWGQSLPPLGGHEGTMSKITETLTYFLRSLSSGAFVSSSIMPS